MTDPAQHNAVRSLVDGIAPDGTFDAKLKGKFFSLESTGSAGGTAEAAADRHQHRRRRRHRHWQPRPTMVPLHRMKLRSRHHHLFPREKSAAADTQEGASPTTPPPRVKMDFATTGQAMNALWRQYMHFILNDHDRHSLRDRKSTITQKTAAFEKIMKADFHGAMVRVVRARNQSMVGVEGVIVQDLMSCFNILSPDSLIKMIPKEPCTFVMTLADDIKVCLFGKAFCTRPADRAVKRWKAANTIDV